jgi:hypothetical protein
MWEGAQSILGLSSRTLGITGDSLTFAGSLVLALEALFKETERLSIDRKRTIVRNFKYAEDREGRDLTDEAVERKWFKLWVFASRMGAMVLALGFAFLLATRILEK